MPRHRGGIALAVLLGLAASSCATRPGGSVNADLEKAEQMPAVDTSNAEGWFRTGLTRQEKGQPESAQVAFERAAEMDPNHAGALVHLGLSLEERGKLDEAMAYYDRAIQAAPEDPRPWINKGSLLYFRRKQTFDAKNAFTRALELDPDNAEGHFNLGVLFADADMFREAAVEWERVLELVEEGPARSMAADNLEKIRPLLEQQTSPASP